VKLSPIKAAGILTAAAGFASWLAPFLPVPYSGLIVAALPVVTAVAGAMLPQVSVRKKPSLPDAKKGARFPTMPPLPLLLLLALGGCGGGANGSVTKDARAALDCVDAASSAPSVRDGLLGCAPPALRVVSTLCAAGVIPPGAFCDEVGGLVQ
jgi:hypothetical protein